MQIGTLTRLTLHSFRHKWWVPHAQMCLIGWRIVDAPGPSFFVYRTFIWAVSSEKVAFEHKQKAHLDHPAQSIRAFALLIQSVLSNDSVSGQ